VTETTTAVRNGDVDWGQFASSDYHAHNYASMRADDARMLGIVRDWFRMAVPAGARLDGIDVGSGSNLYPALALLPYCDTVTLYEYSPTNVEWLRGALADVPAEWAQFWDVASEGLGNERCPTCNDWEAARTELAKRATVKEGSIFDLAKRRWQVGTSFFCSDSLTEDLAEFEEALGCFHACLVPGAPFAVACMENSEGYDVAGTWFPAVPIVAGRLLDVFDRLGAEDVVVHRVDIDPVPIRAGYTGYLVATGRA
jgi:NNMT/PNMT/TEMT family